MEQETNKERQPKIGRKLFNVIDLTKAITTAKTAKKRESKPRGKYKSTKTKEDNYIEPTITERQILTVEDGSIQDYINSCHPDIQQYITRNEAKQFTAKAGGLVIVCKNGIRIDIKDESNGRRVIIKDKKNILFNNITKVVHIERKAS